MVHGRSICREGIRVSKRQTFTVGALLPLAALGLAVLIGLAPPRAATAEQDERDAPAPAPAPDAVPPPPPEEPRTIEPGIPALPGIPEGESSPPERPREVPRLSRPKASAQYSGTPAPGLRVTLSAEGSRGGDLSYRRVQTQGPTVMLDDPAGPIARFPVPEGAGRPGFLMPPRPRSSWRRPRPSSSSRSCRSCR